MARSYSRCKPGCAKYAHHRGPHPSDPLFERRRVWTLILAADKFTLSEIINSGRRSLIARTRRDIAIAEAALTAICEEENNLLQCAWCAEILGEGAGCEMCNPLEVAA